jgi:uncharacterized membrane protein YbhN (UPF0104 family)
VTKHTRLALQFAGWLAATALLVFCLREVNGREVRDALRLMKWQWIAAALVANAAILLAWTGLWWTVAPREERPGYSTMFEINSIASALMNTVPLLGGHAAAVVLLVKRGGMTQHGALSVMALDQLGEGMAKVAIFALVAVSAPIPDWMRVGIGTVCVGVATLLVLLLVAAHGHLHIRGPDGQPGIVARARAFAAEWASRMETLRSAKQSAVALAFAIGTKVAQGAGILAVQQAFGVHLSIGATSLVLAAVILGSMLPVAPGNIGTYEAAAFLAYRHLGIEPGAATILAVAGHLCFLIPSVGIGYLLGSARVAALSPRAKPLSP